MLKDFFYSLNLDISVDPFDPSILNYWGGNPIFKWVSGDQYRDPSRIIEWGGKYYFFASRFTANTFAGDTSEEIGVFESDVFFGTYTYMGIALSISSTGLDNRTIFTPDVIVKDNIIYMFYSGSGTSNSDRWNGFVASSNNPLTSFTRVQTDPILYNSIDGSGLAWENYRIDALTPALTPSGDIRLYYKGVSGDAVGGITNRQFGYAEFTTFPTVAVKSLNNPFFSSSNTYNGDNPEGPSIWYQDNKYWMVYATPSSTGFGFSSSLNGVTNWVQEHTFLADAGYQRWHGAAMCLDDSNRLKAVLFHDEAGNDDCRELSFLV